MLTGYAQIVAVILMAVGLVIFPLGLDSQLVQEQCGATDAYDAGRCSLGWGYMLAIVGTVLAIFCPIFSKYTTVSFADYELNSVT